MFCRLALLVLLAAMVCRGQLTADQKLADFQHLAGLFAKQYAPYEWKLAVEGYDLFDLRPWLDRVRVTKDDLDFHEVMVEYVARLNDAHSIYTTPSTFSANLGFTIDCYDGRVLIDLVNRQRLPESEYPFRIGDELVAVDGIKVEDLIPRFLRYSVSPNPRAARRTAAARIVTRGQDRMPHASEIPEYAEIVVRREGQEVSTHVLRWSKTGLPLTTIGPVPSPKTVFFNRAWSIQDDYLEPLRELRNCALPGTPAVLGVGGRGPTFRLPSGFTQRLGRLSSDFFYSGVYSSAGYRIGFLRISSFAPTDPASAIAQFQREIAYFQNDTDGLVIDEMRNSGGDIGYANSLLRYLIPERFSVIGFEIRATSAWVTRFSAAVESARSRGVDSSTIELLNALLDDVRTANRENRGRTGPLPLDGPESDREPASDASGAPLAYTKPLIVLVDEFTASAAEAFAATIQDHGRGHIAGMRTMGAGGSVVTLSAGSFSEGSTGITQALMSRKRPVVTSEYPPAPYIEAIGVRPDIEIDYMTRANLLEGGRAFVASFTESVVELIRKQEGR